MSGTWIKRAAYFSVVSCAIICPVFVSACMESTAAVVERRVAGLSERFGVLVGYGSPSSFFVRPFSTADANIAEADVSQVKLSAVPPALDGISEGLEVYPEGFYSELCHAIYISGSFAPPRERSGGTYGPSWIILVANVQFGRDVIYENARLGVHHEFSSLVWNRFPVLRAQWAFLMPEGWSPALTATESLHASPSLSDTPRDGFLSPYAATSTENDFNTYAEVVFTAPQRIVDWSRSNSLVAKKTTILMDAYIQLDPRMRDTFRQLGLEEVRSHRGPDTEISIGPISIPQGEIITVPAE